MQYQPNQQYRLSAEDMYRSKVGFLYQRRVDASEGDLAQGVANPESIERTLKNLKKMPKARRERMKLAGTTYEILLDRAQKLYRSHAALSQQRAEERARRDSDIADLTSKWNGHIAPHIEDGVIDYEIDAPTLAAFYEKARALNAKDLVQRIQTGMKGLRAFNEYVREENPAAYLAAKGWTPEAKVSALRILKRYHQGDFGTMLRNCYDNEFAQVRNEVYATKNSQLIDRFEELTRASTTVKENTSVLHKIGDYFASTRLVQSALRAAGALMLAAAMSCGNGAEPPKAPAANPPAAGAPAPAGTPGTAPAPAAPQAAQPGANPAPTPQTPAPSHTHAPTQAQTNAAPAPRQEPPVPQPEPPRAISKPNASIKGILYGSAYLDSDVSRLSNTDKLILDFGDVGLDAYFRTAKTKQQFDTSDVDTESDSLLLGAHGHLNLGKGIRGFGEIDALLHNKSDTEINPDIGSKFKFGKESRGISVKLGLTDGEMDDEDNFGVANKSNQLLAQVTKEWGDVTGDAPEAGFDDEYTALRMSLRSRLMITDKLSLEAGASMIDEEYGDFLAQKNWYAQGGVRWHLDIGERAAYLEALALYQDLHSDVMGKESDDRKIGFQLGFGGRVLDGSTSPFTMDLAINAGFLDSKENDDEWYIAPSVTLWLGGRKKK